MSAPHSPALDFAVELLCAAAADGVRDVVVCPGSRSQALALVAGALERLGEIRLHVRIDERSAAFFALGIALETRRAVPVITTSGTAAAELHPALLEALHAGAPLVAVTADRPAELVGTGANQAAHQQGMFGPYLPTEHVPAPEGLGGEAERACSLGRTLAHASGPMHLDVAFRDPLSAPLPPIAERMRAARAASDAEPDPASWAAASDGARASILELDPSRHPRAIVIAGANAGEAAEATAFAGGWPLVAEPSSGARFGRNLVVAYRDLLGAASAAPELRDGVELAIVYGRPTLSREIPAVLARPGMRTVVVRSPGVDPYAPPGASIEAVDALRLRGGAASDRPGRPGTRAWLGAWLAADRRLLAERDPDPASPDVDAARSDDPRARGRFARAELAVGREPVTRRILVDALWRVTWPGDRLVLGASRLIRDLDAQVRGKRIAVYANRGLAGIDGTIATALGVASAAQAEAEAGTGGGFGVTRVLVGDLTFLHDASSLLDGQGGEPRPRIQVVVGVDGGGTIFDGLEVASTADPELFERVLRTPQHADLAALAHAYGEDALTGSDRQIVIEVPLGP